MSRSRSPAYPNFSLRQALPRAERIFNADRRNPIDREVAAKHMGYSGISGAADKALATMQHFGLLERVGKGELRITNTAVEILHPNSQAERRRALYDAAFSPALFKELKGRFPDGVSEEQLKSWLIRENFLDRAIAPVTSSYTDTLAYLKQENAYESGGLGASDAPESSSVSDDEDDDMNTVETIERPALRSGGIAPSTRQPATAPGMRQAVFTLEEGDVYLSFPADLTAAGYEELSDYLQIFLRRAKRQKPDS